MFKEAYVKGYQEAYRRLMVKKSNALMGYGAQSRPGLGSFSGYPGRGGVQTTQLGNSFASGLGGM